MKELEQMYEIKESGVGLDMTHLDYCPSDDYLENFSYLHTSIRSSNDHIISSTLEDIKEKTLVTEVEFTDKMSTGLLSHLMSIGRDWIDILEIPASCNWTEDTANQLKHLLDTGMIYDISIKNPESPEKLNDILAILESENVKASYVSLDLSPLHFNYDLIKSIKDLGLSILGYNPMGGYFTAPQALNSFTAPYLLSFAATYCNVVFVSSRDMYKAIQDAQYLKGLYLKKTEPMFILRKNVNKLQKPLKKVVYTSIILDDGIQLPYNTPEFVPTGDDSILINLGKEIVKTDENLETLSDLEKELTSLINNLDFPSDATDLDKFSISKNQIIAFLKTKFSNHTFFYSKINDTTVAVKAQKETVEGWFKKTLKTDNHEFIISMIPGGRVYIREIRKKEYKND